MKTNFKIKLIPCFLKCLVLIGFILVFGTLVLATERIPDSFDLKIENRNHSEKINYLGITAELKPEPRFITSLPEKIKQKKEIKVEIKNAINVELYSRRQEGLTRTYLTQGAKEEGNVWGFSFDSRNIPNGNYVLVLKIENQYGSYEKEIPIVIENKIEKNNLEEQQLRKEIEEEKKKIETKEEETKVKAEEIKTSILKEIKSSAEKVMENFSEPEKQEIKKEMEQIHSEIEKGVAEKIEKLSENKEEEIKKENQLKENKKEEGEIIKKIEPILPAVREIKEIDRKKIQSEFQEPITLLKEDNEKKLSQQENLQRKIQKETIAIFQELKEIKEEKGEIKKELKNEISKPVQLLSEEKPEIRQAAEKEIEILRAKTDEKLEELEQAISHKEEFIKDTLVKAVTDSDNDNISDEEELIMGTNPFQSDSDNDGFRDDIEIEEGFNPLSASPADKIIHEEPKKSKAPISENYKIKKIEMIELATKEKGLKIQGKGIPNTFVTIYVYSEPYLVLVAKTDAYGNFVYVLDKPLKKGAHQVYVAVTDNKGEIKERSEVFNFIKTETAVAAILPPSIPEELISPTENVYQVYTLLVISIVIFSLGLALFIIGILTYQKKKIS